MSKRHRFISVIIVFLSIFYGYKASAAQDNLYYKDKIRTSQAAKLLEDKPIKSSYVVILDSGIDYKYEKQNQGKYIYGTRCVPAWGEYHKDPWTSYAVGINHGSEVQFVCDEIISDLRVNNEKQYSLNQPIMTIQYKISEPDGTSNVERLVYAINDVIDQYVIKEKLNVAAINFSSIISFKGVGNEKIEKLKKDLELAIKRASSFGITFVTAAGNDNTEIYNYSSNFDNVITVGSIDANNNRALWGKSGGSCFGKQLDIVAPGDKLLVFNKDKKPVIDSGTSYSAPMVSAVIGLMKGINSELKPSDIEEILKSTSTDLGKKGRDDYFGYGLLNIEKVVETLIKRDGSFE